MMEWWSNLSWLNQAFYIGAVFFSLLFLWQFIMSLIGLAGHGADIGGDHAVDASHEIAGDHGADAHADHAGDTHVDTAGHAGAASSALAHIAHGEQPPEVVRAAHHEAARGRSAFRLLSVRSVLAFLLLYTWAMAMCLSSGTGPIAATFLALIWGGAAMVIVAGMLYLLSHLVQSGTAGAATCVGSTGTVYLDIPVNGTGEIRVLCGGALTNLRARGAEGQAIKTGASVLVLWAIDPMTVQVKPYPLEEK